jgi:hypothetical protein
MSKNCDPSHITFLARNTPSEKVRLHTGAAQINEKKLADPLISYSAIF